MLNILDFIGGHYSDGLTEPHVFKLWHAKRDLLMVRGNNNLLEKLKCHVRTRFCVRNQADNKNLYLPVLSTFKIF